jgi:general secretion pathway protein M
MDWIRNNSRFAVIVGATLAIPLLLVLSILGDLWGIRQDYQRQVDRLEPRLARLQGMIESEEQLRTTSGKVTSVMTDLVYPLTDAPASIAATLQTHVRDILTRAGLKVGNSRILPVRVEQGFEHVGLSLKVSGEISALDEALFELSQYKPLLLVESVEINPGRPPRRGSEVKVQSVVATLQVLSLRTSL